MSPATSPWEPQIAGGPQINGVCQGAPVTRQCSVPFGLPFMAGCGSTSPSGWDQCPGQLLLSHAVCPSLRLSAHVWGPGPGGLPPGSSLLPRFPCPRADITAQHCSPSHDSRAGDKRTEEGRTEGPPSPSEGGDPTSTSCSGNRDSTVRSPSFPPHRPPGETEAQAQGRGQHRRPMRFKLPPTHPCHPGLMSASPP